MAGMKKVSVDGGMPISLTTNAGWAAWNTDNVILVEPVSGERQLMQTTGSGGALAPLDPPVKNGGSLGFVSFLPDGRRFLHQYLEPGKPQDQSSTYVGSLDSPERRLVMTGPNASQALFANGSLLIRARRPVVRATLRRHADDADGRCRGHRRRRRANQHGRVVQHLQPRVAGLSTLARQRGFASCLDEPIGRRAVDGLGRGGLLEPGAVARRQAHAGERARRSPPHPRHLYRRLAARRAPAPDV